MCMCVAMAIPVRLGASEPKFGSLWSLRAAESSHLPPTSVTVRFRSPSLPWSQFFSPAALALAVSPPRLPLHLSASDILFIFPPLSVCALSLFLTLLPNRLCVTLRLCVFDCEFLLCLQAVGHAWLMTLELLFWASGPFLYSQANSWLPPSIIIPICHFLSGLVPILSLFLLLSWSVSRFCLSFLRYWDAVRECLQILHKHPLRFKDDAIKFWGFKGHGHLTKINHLLFNCDKRSHKFLTGEKMNIFYFLSLSLHAVRYTAVIHHKWIVFAGIELQVIVVVICDKALEQSSLLLSKK